MIYLIALYLVLGFIIVLCDWFFFIDKEVKGNGSVFLLPICVLFWPIYLISIIICRYFLKKNKKNNENNKNDMKTKEKIKYGSTASLDKGFHPEILYVINKDYAEYVDFKEVN